MTDAELHERAKEEKRAYQREWYAKNRDKARERNRRYWERKALLSHQTQEAVTQEG